MKLNHRQRFLTIVTVAALALLAADRLVLTPLTNAWKNRAKEIARLRAQVAEGTSLLRREQAIRSRWNEMRTNTLPDNPSLAQEQVLRGVVGWAQESGTSINAITPQWKTDADDYKTLVCRVDAAGTLWTLTRFLYDIERAPMAAKLESVDLSARDNSGQQLTLSLQLSALALTATRK
jgi:Tfp pilus assembly protein PilO